MVSIHARQIFNTFFHSLHFGIFFLDHFSTHIFLGFLISISLQDRKKKKVQRKFNPLNSYGNVPFSILTFINFLLKLRYYGFNISFYVMKNRFDKKKKQQQQKQRKRKMKKKKKNIEKMNSNKNWEGFLKVRFEWKVLAIIQHGKNT